MTSSLRSPLSIFCTSAQFCAKDFSPVWIGSRHNCLRTLRQNLQQDSAMLG